MNDLAIGGGIVVEGCVVEFVAGRGREIALTERSRAGVLAAVPELASFELPLVISVYCASTSSASYVNCIGRLPLEYLAMTDACMVSAWAIIARKSFTTMLR